MDNLLCKLGIHKWKPHLKLHAKIGQPLFSDCEIRGYINATGNPIKYRCSRCGKKRLV